MNEFMHILSKKMSDWMSVRFPSLCDNWWEELVINNLNSLQRDQVESKEIKGFSGLDLSSLLRVLDRNWYIITGKYFMNFSDRKNIKEMLNVRNSWAHITNEAINKEKVITDVNVIINLMATFGAGQNEINELQAFLLDINVDNSIKEKSNSFAANGSVKTNDLNDTDNDISIGDVVSLSSDDNCIGAVVNVSGELYYVLIDGTIKTFYREQLNKHSVSSNSNHVTLSEIKTALTAHEINNPGARNLYSLNSARIDFVPYQFRPALKIIKSDVPRLLIADDVGVGKTIEAGLILKELEARSSIDSILVICPRPLVAERKWELEMKRFDENFTQMDGKEFSQAISDSERDGEWPDRHKKTIIPYSLFGEDSIMGTESKSEKKHKTTGLMQLDPLPHFDLVIVDEAHTIRNSNTWAYAAVELFCRNADAVVFMTATPLQNSNNDLYTLLNLLRPDIVIDKDTFQTMAEPNEYVNNLLRTIRTLPDGWNEYAKEQINSILSTTWGRNVIQHNPNFEKIYQLTEKDNITREEKVDAITMVQGLHSFNDIITRTRRRDIEDFCIRRTQTVKAPFTDDQQDLYDALMEFESTALTLLHGSRSVKFMMCTIMRQASSCIYGLAPFMDDIVRKKLDQIQEDGELFELNFELNSDEENTLLQLADEIGILSKNLSSDDPKIEHLYEIIDKKQSEENNRVIIFSSFRNTLKYIRENLKKKGYRVAQVDGSVPDEERFKIRSRFLLDRNDPGAIDVLLFSEVGCEGLDYQFCDTMVNYDLPWNPMRIEQRIGRIDRRGQTSSSVKIYNMITEGTIDAVIYDRCLSKIGVFEASIGDCSKILGDISEKIMQIMFSSDLSESERKEKIEQLADNDVSKIQEMRRLEQDEKSLFGFDLSQYIQSKEVQDAENKWINPDLICDLTEKFLNDFLGDNEYLLGKSEMKTLRISRENRIKLLENLRQQTSVINNISYKKWVAYLKGDKPSISITFDAACAKENPDALFFTQMHPAVVQASQYESKTFPCTIGVSVSNDELPKGEHEFLVYVWEYVGLKPDVKLVPISENESIQSFVFTALQEADEYNFSDAEFEQKWNEMDTTHYSKWQKARKNYISQVEEDCNYRIEQLEQTNRKRELVIKNRLLKETDERIIRMKQSEMARLADELNTQKDKITSASKKADIHSTLLVKGILKVI